jgi:hypothetical protein
LKNEEPLLEAKAKFDGSEVTSSTVKKQGFFGSSSSDSNSKKGILKRIMSLPSRLMFWKK